MTDDKEQPLSKLLQDAKTAAAEATDVAALEQLRVFYLGKKGVLTEQLKRLGQLPAEQRPEFGKQVNIAKQQVQAAIAVRKEALQSSDRAQQLASEQIDVSLPGRGRASGGLHPVTRTIERLERLFAGMGFEIADGPEIEDDFHNFEALNFPEDHPARAMHDTFFLKTERCCVPTPHPCKSVLWRVMNRLFALSRRGGFIVVILMSHIRPCFIRSKVCG